MKEEAEDSIYIFELLCSKSRLDRERGLNHLNSLVVENESCLVNIKQSLTDLLKSKYFYCLKHHSSNPILTDMIKINLLQYKFSFSKENIRMGREGWMLADSQ